MISYTGTHLWWLLQLAAHISIKVWCNRIFFIWKGWILLSQTNEIESWNMILTIFLNRTLLNQGRNHLRFSFLISLLFIEDIGNLWYRLPLPLRSVIVRWLIGIFITGLVTRWLSGFLGKRLVINRFQRWVFEKCLWYLLSYLCLVSWLFSLYPKNFAKLFLIFWFC